MENQNVLPLFKIVAAGFWPDGRGRVTVTATPVPAQPGQGFALAQWPQQMRSLFVNTTGKKTAARNFAFVAAPKMKQEVHSAESWTAAAPDTKQKQDITGTAIHLADIAPAVAAQVQSLWSDAFTTVSGEKVWGDLLRIIDTSASGRKMLAKLSTHADEPDLEGLGHMPELGSGPSQTYTVKTIVSARQSDLAFQLEVERAHRVAEALSRPTLASPERLALSDLRPSEETPAARELTSPERQKGILDAKKKELQSVVQATQNDRTSAEKRFSAEKQRLTDNSAGPRASTDNKQSAAKTDPDARKEAAQTQLYSGWPQKMTGSHEQMERLSQIYHLLQGDPGFARLFGFMIDLAISEEDMKKLGAYLFLAPPEVAGQSRVWTATKYAAEGALFYPVSKDEIDAPAEFVSYRNGGKTVAAIISTLDQFDGITVAGSGASPKAEDHNPRYGLVSVDMRRAAELTGNQTIHHAGAGAKTLHTAGLVVVDRQRAAEVQLQAARTAHFTEKLKLQNELFLYADDLAIGKRLDVAVSRNDKEIWRCLMNRSVSYDFRLNGKALPDVKKAINILIGSPGSAERTDLDAASMVFAARFVPRQSAQEDIGQAVDAVVDEAIVLWDGTPMGVFCGPKRPVPGETKLKQLPFRRTLDLPSGATAGTLRPPALRYGRGYRLAMRSTFLGGRAIPLDEHGEHLRRSFSGAAHVDMTPYLAFPARFEDKPTPASQRRFLRQSAVAAPQVLLPQHVATCKNGAMGFEHAAQVVLRVDNSPPDNELTAFGAAYVPAASRVAPTSTMRVVVPPSLPLDEIVRHGMLDSWNYQDLLPGGLRDVRYDRLMPVAIASSQFAAGDAKPPAPKLVPAGFPIAVTTSKPGVDGIETEYFRQLYYNTELPGDAVFVPGRDIDSRTPYFPDPAAQVYVLRVRDRGTNAWLPGSLQVPVYPAELGGWPHALPLALMFQKVTSSQGEKTAGTVLRHTLPAIQHLGAGGLAADGAHVGVVAVLLSPNDDFSVEVTCMPCADMLAQQFTLPETIGAVLAAHGNDTGSLRLKQLFSEETLARMDCKPPVDAAACHCATGGHAGGDDAQLHAIATALFDHVAEHGRLEELAAYAEIRAACVLSRPEHDVTFADGISKEFKDQFEDIDWLKAAHPGTAATTTLFGLPQALRPAPLVEKQAVIDAAKLAKLVAEAVPVPNSFDYLLTGGLTLDLRGSDGFEIVAETVSPHSAAFDDTERKRSLKAKRAGRWPTMLNADAECVQVPVAGVLGFHSIDGKNRVRLKRAMVRLFNCSTLPRDDGNLLWPRDAGLSRISLAMVHQAARHGAIVVEELPPDDGKGEQTMRCMFKAEQDHVFTDGKARLLKLKARAHGRFAGDWETSDRWSDLTADGVKLLRHQPLSSHQQSRDGPSVDVWLPASKEPAKCVARTPMPVFRTERFSLLRDGRTEHHVERKAASRIYLARSWFSSGEGERLGVVIWPPQHFDGFDKAEASRFSTQASGPKVRELRDEFAGPAGSFISRWGGDPIRGNIGMEKEPLIPAKNFADVAHLWSGLQSQEIVPHELARLRASPHDPKIVRCVRMPVVVPIDQANKAEQRVMTQVTLITYEPCFDADREEWYVDVEITPSGSSNPFVRLGLVRYQEHAPPDLQLSEPVAVWSQLMPRRTAIVTPSRNKAGEVAITADVFGLAQSEVKYPPGGDKADAAFRRALDRPHMRFAIVYEAEDSAGLRRSLLTAAIVNPDAPDGYLDVDESPGFEHGEAHWQLNVKLDVKDLASRTGGRFYAYLEEYERRMPASYVVEPVQMNDILNINTLVESGPRFSLRVPFEIPVATAMANDP